MNLQLHKVAENTQKSNIISDYKPEFCDWYIAYAKENLNPDGFWGKHNIDESMKETWIKLYPEFKKTVALVPNITTDCLNQLLGNILTAAKAIGDVKTITQVVMKALDFKNTKEAGEIKEKGRTNKMARDVSDLDVSDLDEQTARDFMSSRNAM